jgi:acetyl esterase/lipase
VSAQKITRQAASLPKISYSLPGDKLMEAAEKHLYKSTAETELSLYLLRPFKKSKKALPAIIYFSGGGWNKQNVEGQIPTAAWFRDQGIIGICAEYRVKSVNGTTPLECIKDAKSAVRYIRLYAKALGINPEKIVVAGGSAGGHIAICTQIDGGDELGEDLSISAKPNALVLHNPVLGGGFGKEFFNVHPEFSPLLQVKAGWPSTILSCGTADKITPFVYAQKFTELMKAAGNSCELIPIKDGPHSADWPVTNPHFLPTITQMTLFLKERNLVPKGKISVQRKKR